MSLMSAPDEHEAYLAARRYMDALTSGAYDQAAECVRPADLEALKKVMLEAVEIILSTHGDDDGFVAMLSTSGDLQELEELSPSAFLARLLAVMVSPSDLEAARPRLTVGRIEDDVAELHYQIVDAGTRHLRLEREGARWYVELHEGLRHMGARLAERARHFAEQRARDRATFTDADDLFPVAVDDEWGFIDRRGELRIAPRFRRAGDFVHGLAPVRVGRSWGYIDGTGKLAIRPQFHGASELCGDFAVVYRCDKNDDKWFGVIDNHGDVRLPLEHEKVSLIEGTNLALSERGGRWVLTELARGIAIENGASALDVVLAWSKGKFLVDDAGEHLVCAGAQPVPAELAHELADSGLVRFVDDGLLGFMDRDGNVVIEPRFAAALPFSQERSAVAVDGKWGFIDLAGNWIVAPRFFDADSFAHGIAPVARDGVTWGYIDRSGQLVVGFELASAERATRGLARVTRTWLGSPGYLRPDGTTLWAAAEDESYDD